MEVEVLGHWVGAPMGAGACSSYLVRGGGVCLLLDCGSGTLPLLLERDLTRRLDAIVISHMHRDHMLDLLPFADLAAVRALYPGCGEWVKPRLLLPPGGVQTLVSLNDVWYAGREDPDGANDPDAPAPSIKRLSGAFEMSEYGDEDRLKAGGLTISFRRTRHGPGPCYAPRVSDGRATLVYSADSGYTPDLADHARGAHLFLCEATFSAKHPYWTEKHGHMTGEDAGRLAAEAGVERLVLTHLGPDPEANRRNLADARARFGGTVNLARVGASFRV
jgi:ribonuclease BN (tRNA processing enzyme)